MSGRSPSRQQDHSWAHMTDEWIARCTCGSVEFQATGIPITSVTCYCDDCQEGARQIEALPNAARILDSDGGSGYLVYRKDRVHCVKGNQLLRPYKIRERSATNRVVATCCNAAMILNFDDSKHWVDVYRNRVQGNVPSIQMRICTKYRRTSTRDTTSVAEYPRYPMRFVAKLIGAKFRMLVGR